MGDWIEWCSADAEAASHAERGSDRDHAAQNKPPKRIPPPMLKVERQRPRPNPKFPFVLCCVIMMNSFWTVPHAYSPRAVFMIVKM
jgi:hypothetical protein